MMNSSKNNNNNNAYPRPTPQTSIGRLVSITVDNPKYYTAPVSASPSASPTIPHLIPIASASAASAAHNDEQTMLWRNIATLFSRCEQNESEIKKQREDYDPCIGVLNQATDELVQETRDLKCRIDELSNELSDELDSKIGQMKKHTRKYVSKKVNKTKQAASGSAFDADMEVFKYVDSVREEFVDTNSQLKEELALLRQELHEEISELNDTYYRDYKMFIQREEDLMAKLDEAVKMNEATNQRMKDLEECLMKQIQQVRNYADTHIAGDLREEFSTAICREVAFESKVSAELVQGVHNELTDLITRSNEYHSARYFGTVEDVKQVREMCQTLKQSIGMVDAELSDTKEIVEYLKDEVGHTVNSVTDLEDKVCDLTEDLVEQKTIIYNEMDHDYSDMKDYVKRRIQSHVRHYHQETAVVEDIDPISMIVTEYSEDAPDAVTADAVTAVAAPTDAVTADVTVEDDDDNIIIMDDTCMISDEE
jgi:hypothetical protein